MVFAISVPFNQEDDLLTILANLKMVSRKKYAEQNPTQDMDFIKLELKGIDVRRSGFSFKHAIIKFDVVRQ